MQAKNIIIALLLLALVGAVGYFLSQNTTVVTEEITPTKTAPVEETPTFEATDSETTTPEPTERGDETIIGTSINGSDITAYHFGTGETELLFIGGVHGGYSWNTALLGYELIDYLDANPNLIPENVTVTIIPVLNPDGLKATVGTIGRFDEAAARAVSESTRIAGRFNTNEVDLNRNFDCDWSETSMWQNKEVSGGDKAFSEPETQALRDYINAHKPTAAVVWFSAEGKVYPSACDSTPSKASVTLAATFAQAAGYTTDAQFDAYTINGDMVNWMAKLNIPAISVLLSDHQHMEWEKNKAGIEAIIASYGE